MIYDHHFRLQIKASKDTSAAGRIATHGRSLRSAAIYKEICKLYLTIDFLCPGGKDLFSFWRSSESRLIFQEWRKSSNFKWPFPAVTISKKKKAAGICWFAWIKARIMIHTSRIKWNTQKKEREKGTFHINLSSLPLSPHFIPPPPRPLLPSPPLTLLASPPLTPLPSPLSWQPPPV